MVFALSNVVSTKHQLLQRWRSLYQRLRQIHSIKELITNAFASRPHMVSARQRLLSVVSWIQLVGHSSLLELSNLSCWLGDFQIVKGLWFCLLCKFTIIAKVCVTRRRQETAGSETKDFITLEQIIGASSWHQFPLSQPLLPQGAHGGTHVNARPRVAFNHA